MSHGDNQQGDAAESAAQMLPAVYEELKRIAAASLTTQDDRLSFRPTDLVHEAFLKLASNRNSAFRDKRQFFAAAGEAMRRILVDRARRRRTLKRGGDRKRMFLDDIAADNSSDRIDILALDEALTRLEQQCPRHAELVNLRFFAGLTIPEAAEALGVSSTTVDNDWAYVKTWLRVEIGGRPDSLGTADQSPGHDATEHGS
jgi:RNA polymerase sigma factor (TIGR02999 family)